jgi:hypothetical protein
MLAFLFSTGLIHVYFNWHDYCHDAFTNCVALIVIILLHLRNFLMLLQCFFYCVALIGNLTLLLSQLFKKFSTG